MRAAQGPNACSAARNFDFMGQVRNQLKLFTANVLEPLPLRVWNYNMKSETRQKEKPNDWQTLSTQQKRENFEPLFSRQYSCNIDQPSQKGIALRAWFWKAVSTSHVILHIARNSGPESIFGVPDVTRRWFFCELSEFRLHASNLDVAETFHNEFSGISDGNMKLQYGTWGWTKAKAKRLTDTRARTKITRNLNWFSHPTIHVICIQHHKKYNSSR